ncbi:unnamed protein product, partial [Rotaria magnacalcarata]
AYRKLNSPQDDMLE